MSRQATHSQRAAAGHLARKRVKAHLPYLVKAYHNRRGPAGFTRRGHLGCNGEPSVPRTIESWSQGSWGVWGAQDSSGTTRSTGWHRNSAGSRSRQAFHA
jgi:hypothetical protein